MESNQRLASRVRRDPSANLRQDLKKRALTKVLNFGIARIDRLENSNPDMSTGKTGKRPSEKQILLEEVEEHFPCRRFR